MSREEQIEQLVKDLNFIKTLQASTIYTPTYQEAICLYELGYRKKDEVLKEFAERLKENASQTIIAQTDYEFPKP